MAATLHDIKYRIETDYDGIQSLFDDGAYRMAEDADGEHFGYHDPNGDFVPWPVCVSVCAVGEVHAPCAAGGVRIHHFESGGLYGIDLGPNGDTETDPYIGEIKAEERSDLFDVLSCFGVSIPQRFRN